MPAPLHSKKAYVFISNGTKVNIVSFANEVSVNWTPQSVSRAEVLGTDAVPGVDAQSYTARARVNLLLSEDEPEWLASFGNRSTNNDQIDVDFDKAVIGVQNETEWSITDKLFMVIVALRNNLLLSQASDFDSLKKAAGRIVILKEAPVVGSEFIARVGDYVAQRIEVETGNWRDIINKKAITA